MINDSLPRTTVTEEGISSSRFCNHHTEGEESDFKVSRRPTNARPFDIETICPDVDSDTPLTR